MANVLHHIDFQPRPVSHAPSPFGFGFGLGANPMLNPVASSSWGAAPTPGHTNVAAFHQLASSITQSNMRPLKRRHDIEEEDDDPSHGARDASMDRSPTPERPKRAAPKRARLVPANSTADKENAGSSESKSLGDEVDVGVLLASLPSQSLLPLFMNLLKAHPALKSDVLPLIPKPTLETALRAIEQASKKLRDAYPYSNTPTSSVSFSFGSTLPPSSPAPSHSSQGGMRDSYITSRIQSQISEFVSCCISYLPYFTSNSSSNPLLLHGSQLTQAIQLMHKHNSHPSETFAFISGVMNQIMSQPPLAISSIAPLLLPRLQGEWHMWVDGIDDVVNTQGGMFGSEAVRGWERALDELAGSRAVEISSVMRPVRDKWVVKVGWLLGRHVPQAMDQH